MPSFRGPARPPPGRRVLFRSSCRRLHSEEQNAIAYLNGSSARAARSLPQRLQATCRGPHPPCGGGVCGPIQCMLLELNPARAAGVAACQGVSRRVTACRGVSRRVAACRGEDARAPCSCCFAALLLRRPAVATGSRVPWPGRSARCTGVHLRPGVATDEQDLGKFLGPAASVSPAVIKSKYFKAKSLYFKVFKPKKTARQLWCWRERWGEC